MNSRILSIDTSRLVAALLVVAIHCWFYPGRDFVIPLARVAVPLFFMISGFFLFSPQPEVTIRRIRASLTKVALIWAIGTLLFALDFLYAGSVSGDYSPLQPTLSTPALWLFCCHQKVGFPLWFLVAMAEALLALWLLLSRWPRLVAHERRWGCLLALLITVGVVLNKYVCSRYPLFGNDDLQYPPLLFMSLPFMLTGYQMRKHYATMMGIIKPHKAVLWGFVVLFALLSEVEGHWAPTCGDSYLFTLPLSLSLFALLLVYPQAGGDRVASWGRRYALWIYVLHVLVYTVIHRLTGSWRHWMLHPAAIFLVTAAMAPLVERLTRPLFRLGHPDRAD